MASGEKGVAPKGEIPKGRNIVGIDVGRYLIIAGTEETQHSIVKQLSSLLKYLISTLVVIN